MTLVLCRAKKCFRLGVRELELLPPTPPSRAECAKVRSTLFRGFAAPRCSRLAGPPQVPGGKRLVPTLSEVESNPIIRRRRKSLDESGGRAITRRVSLGRGFGRTFFLCQDFCRRCSAGASAT